MSKLKFLSWAALLTLPMIFFSCGDDDDDPSVPGQNNPSYNLTVSPTDITIMSEKGSSGSFTITTDGSWKAQSDSDWLLLSSTGGSGNATITITALSVNDSSSSRDAMIIITWGDNSTTVNVTQIGAFQANCNVEITNILALTTSVAFDIVADSNVDYFYMGYLSSESAGWTDERIVSVLEENFEPYNADEDLEDFGFGDLKDNSNYYLCAVGYDKKGERGELFKTRVKTPADKNTAPFVSLSDFKVDDENWYWTSTPDAYTSKYYMYAWNGIYAYNVYWDYYDAQIAKAMKQWIDDGDLTVIAQGGSWIMPIDDIYLTVATWGLDAYNEYSPKINLVSRYITNSTKSDLVMTGTRNDAKSGRGLTKEELSKLKEAVKVYRVE